ncbi:MAG: CHRD domain-containing protein [Pseudolabrys sp.]|nr:CHRD domain-containing protein [Pseudolabrys sp.]
MTSTFLRSTVAAVTCTVAIALAGPALAAMVNLKSELSGKAEVPANDSKGTGSVTATFDTDSKKLTWKGTYSGLSGPATAAHFHTGEAGKNGGVAVPIFAGAAAKSPFEGSATLTDAQVADLLAGKLYTNIHTEANKGGEIRGQLTK